MPTNQKADQRPIAFRLDTGLGNVVHVPLVIRPEELVSDEPVLQTPVKTLGGAFIDDFGRDIQAITISGHTGWGGGKRPDGVEEFKKLAGMRVQWHESRAKLAKSGLPPANCKLFFIDDLNEICVVVAPGRWQLKRSRSRPLLMMYNLPMTVLTDKVQPSPTDPIDTSAATSAAKVTKALASLSGSIGRITAAAADARSFIQSSLVSPLQSVMGKATGAMQQVVDVVNSARGVVTDEAMQVGGLATDLALVGRNAFYTYNAVVSLPDFVGREVSAVAGEFNNAFCVLRNAFRKAPEYPDYDGIYGASNCSSTVGGSPISPYVDRNPWEFILPTQHQVAAVTPEARANIDALKRTDPVRAPMGLSELSARVQAAMDGVSFSWL